MGGQDAIGLGSIPVGFEQHDHPPDIAAGAVEEDPIEVPAEDLVGPCPHLLVRQAEGLLIDETAEEA